MITTRLYLELRPWLHKKSRGRKMSGSEESEGLEQKKLPLPSG